MDIVTRYFSSEFCHGLLLCHKLLFCKLYGLLKILIGYFENFQGLLKIFMDYSIKCHGKDNNNGLCYPVEIYQGYLPDNHSVFGSRRT